MSQHSVEHPYSTHTHRPASRRLSILAVAALVVGLTSAIVAPASAATNYTLTYTAGVNGTIAGHGFETQTVTSGGTGTPETATANTGYHFLTWSDSSTANPRTDTNVLADLSVIASFAIDTHTLRYLAGDHGAILGVTSQTVNYGDSGTAVTAAPALGYNFVSWSDSSTANPRIDTSVATNISVTAIFASNGSHTLTYLAGTNGIILGVTPQTIAWNGSGTAVTAVANAGYHFVNWSDGLLTATRTDVNVLAGFTVTANFAANVAGVNYTLTYLAGTNGTISGTTPQIVVSSGSGNVVTAVPNAGYHFVNWSDGVLTATRTDVNVWMSLSVLANFAANPVTVTTYTLTYLAGSNGTISGTTPQTVVSGASGVAVVAVPNAGYRFLVWSDGVLTATRTDINVLAAHTFTANFANIVVGPVTVPGHSRKWMSANAYFKANSAVLTAAGYKSLGALVSNIRRAVPRGYLYAKLVVKGFVRPTHSTVHDKRLSVARAKAVAKQLRKLGIRGSVKTIGKGRAIAHTATGRRAEAVITLTLTR